MVLNNRRILIGALGNIGLKEGNVYRLRHIAATLGRDDFDVRFAAYLNGISKSDLPGWFATGNGIAGMLQVVVIILWRVLTWRPGVLVLSHLGSPFLGIVALIAKLAGCRIVFDCQDWPPDTVQALYESLRFRRTLIAWVRFSMWCLDRVCSLTFVVSDGISRTMRCAGWRGPLLQVPNIHSAVRYAPVNAPEYRSDPEWVGATIVIYAGGLQKTIRGIETQLAAVAAARAAGGNVRMVLAGGGDPAYFARLSHSLGIADAVRILGPVSRECVDQLIEQADVAVLEPTTYILPSKSFEYICHGLCVMASERCSDVHQTFGDLITAFDGTEAHLARLLLAIDRNEELIRRPKRRERGENLVTHLRLSAEESIKSAFRALVSP